MAMVHTTRPTPAELRELSDAELGLIVLNVMTDDFNISNKLNTDKQTHDQNGEADAFYLLERLSDAWSWLVARGLVGPHPVQGHGWSRRTSRGAELLAEGNLTALLADSRLPDDLHPLLSEARRLFRAGNPELAVFESMKQVEVRLRSLSQSGDELIGTRLARLSLHPENGPLADPRLEPGEREAVAHLFAGALGTFKNPTSHRVVKFDDPARAADAILLGDLLMRMLDETEARLKRPEPSVS